ncbi:hypothetical protein [Dictyobacter vulcani]|uniref:hypothetical protein n=1 Tax=Dictyobacter vulcani TaxID=2607529 RepID=UPI00124FB254|nr:hypothetical protein [Dictyobacter vulcani]
MPVTPPPRRIVFRDPLRTGTRIHALFYHVAVRAGNGTAPTIPGGATALRIVLARWPAQTQQGGLRVWRPLDVHMTCWSRRTISLRLANRNVLALVVATCRRPTRHT